MGENGFWLRGTFSLTDMDRMCEMNDLILDILRKTGIGKLTTKTVNGKEIYAFKQASPDNEGIVEFDFSIFEKKQRNGNYYDTKSGRLAVSDIGKDKFALSTVLIMTVLESYSETPCYLMYENDFNDVYYKAQIIKELTGKTLYFGRRARSFDGGRFINDHNIAKLYYFKNEDNFIGLWNNADMILSSAMLERLETYKRAYSQIDIENLNGFDTLSVLLSCLADLDTLWRDRRYIEYDLLEEIIENQDAVYYKKAVYTLRKLIDDEIQMYSELTQKQIRTWIIDKVNWQIYPDMFWHYLDILSNRPKRKELFGF